MIINSIKLILAFGLMSQVSCSKPTNGLEEGAQAEVHEAVNQDDFAVWRSSVKEKRHEHLSLVLGHGWSLNLSHELLDLEESPLSGLSRSEVVERLGTPDVLTRWGVMYRVGYVTEPSLSQKSFGTVVPGMKIPEDTLIIDFADNDGDVNRIMLTK